MSNSRANIIVAIGLGFCLASQAQAMSLGEFEFANSCAQCHGVSGEGGGPVGDFLRTPPPDLTILQKNNGGVFPVTDLFSTIEGKGEASVHGSSDMPLWGARYRQRLDEDLEAGFSPAETDVFITTRILSLIEYLSTLQVE